jgi:hypothetical protein
VDEVDVDVFVVKKLMIYLLGLHILKVDLVKLVLQWLKQNTHNSNNKKVFF